MKKLFIFASSMVIASMIYSADTGNNINLSVVRIIKHSGTYHPRVDALSLWVNPQNTVQSLINTIKDNPEHSDLLLTKLRFEGIDLTKNPGQSLADAGLKKWSNVYATLTDEEESGEYIKGDPF